MASLSVYTTVILVCPAVLERAQLSTTPSSSSSGTTLATTTTKQNAITAALATSFSSTPTVTSSFPTSTSSVTQAETARLTASAVLPSSAPSYVLVPIHTTVSIDVFPSNLPPGSREGYVPTYEAHRDVSSVCWVARTLSHPSSSGLPHHCPIRRQGEKAALFPRSGATATVPERLPVLGR